MIRPDLSLPIPETIEAAHFIGIGGSGMSGLARMFLARGIRVSGRKACGFLIHFRAHSFVTFEPRCLRLGPTWRLSVRSGPMDPSPPMVWQPVHPYLVIRSYPFCTWVACGMSVTWWWHFRQELWINFWGSIGSSQWCISYQPCSFAHSSFSSRVSGVCDAKVNEVP